MIKPIKHLVITHYNGSGRWTAYPAPHSHTTAVREAQI